MNRFLRIQSVLLILISIFGSSANAIDLAVNVFPAGKSGVTSKSYCSNFYIKKNGDQWAMVDSNIASLLDEKTEQLVGCLASNDVNYVNAVVFDLGINGKCKIYCLDGFSRPTNCIRYDEKKYLANSSPRSEGYYGCNSNLANNPSEYNALINSDLLKNAATDYVRANFNISVIGSINANPETCDLCYKEIKQIEAVFRLFYPYVSGADLNTIALKYIEITGSKKLPDWISLVLSPEEVNLVENNGKKSWMARYEKQIKAASAQTYHHELQELLHRKSSKGPKNWNLEDFNELVVKVEKEIEGRYARAEEGRKKELQKVTAWRRTVAVGDDTFCGPVIEKKGSMVKIAVRAQLAGYSNEAWLKSSEIYPASYGCVNRNGNLSPQ